MKTQRPQPPRKLPHKGRRSRKFLREPEVHQLIYTAQRWPNGHRNATLIYMMYRHGLRVSEACALTWEQVDLDARRLFVKRLKNGKPSVQELTSEQSNALQELKRSMPEHSPYVFTTPRGTRLDRSTVYKMIRKTGERAKLGLVVNTHKMRHACGYHLTNVRKVDLRRIQDYLGHKDIKHTVAYTELAEDKFDGIWGDHAPPSI